MTPTLAKLIQADFERIRSAARLLSPDEREQLLRNVLASLDQHEDPVVSKDCNHRTIVDLCRLIVECRFAVTSSALGG
jgi:hypothetical protein